MNERQTNSLNDSRPPESTGAATLRQIMDRLDERVATGAVSHLRALPTGFRPLDDVLNGGLQAGELMIVGGKQGVGKTIFGLQIARNAAYSDDGSGALFICYEHTREHLFSRLLCLESAEQGCPSPLTLKKLNEIALREADGVGLVERLRRLPGYQAVVDAVEAYGERLVLVKASGDRSTLRSIRRWVEGLTSTGAERFVVVVDYLQKIPIDVDTLQPEAEATTYLTQSLKDLAMETGVRVVAIAASDRPGLKSKRVRLADMRGSSALQYEADVALMLNNKYDIVSREHLISNLSRAEQMRSWLVVTLEKNRSGRSAVDMEHAFQPAQFRMVPTGDFVRERLVDEKVITE
ncbi:MAG: DnaB-like helicase C-terminal domain-containing protein [Anaerolineae bacterium]